MSLSQTEIERITRQVDAILEEADARPQTGREIPGVGAVPDNASVASLIDHTLLKPDAMARQIERLCFEAKEFEFASVCVNSIFVSLAAEMLKDSPVKVCTVVGFPLGASLTSVKSYEARQAIEQGATEVDMVLPIGLLKSRDTLAVFNDITEVAAVCHDRDVLCKVILETALLTDEEKVVACQIVKRAGADFVKTSTGFGGGGATVDDVALMRGVVGEGVGVKASGGVRDLESAQKIIEAGANRIGASAGVAIAQAEHGGTVANDSGDGY
ncbi:MAG: deoxyribose-phosphate aldolase [Aggregatilineales bacterium]